MLEGGCMCEGMHVCEREGVCVICAFGHVCVREGVCVSMCMCEGRGTYV